MPPARWTWYRCGFDGDDTGGRAAAPGAADADNGDAGKEGAAANDASAHEDEDEDANEAEEEGKWSKLPPQSLPSLPASSVWGGVCGGPSAGRVGTVSLPMSLPLSPTPHASCFTGGFRATPLHLARVGSSHATPGCGRGWG